MESNLYETGIYWNFNYEHNLYHSYSVCTPAGGRTFVARKSVQTNQCGLINNKDNKD